MDLALAGTKDDALRSNGCTRSRRGNDKGIRHGGARIGGADEDQLKSLASYADAVGLAFQIIDDILDVEGEGDIGKERGNDERRGKSTYPGLAGIEESKRKASELTRKAVGVLEGFDHRAEALRQIALYLGSRNH
jgi:geranylgeranyl diphosphate synthase type II